MQLVWPETEPFSFTVEGRHSPCAIRASKLVWELAVRWLPLVLTFFGFT